MVANLGGEDLRVDYILRPALSEITWILVFSRAEEARGARWQGSNMAGKLAASWRELVHKDRVDKSAAALAWFCDVLTGLNRFAAVNHREGCDWSLVRFETPWNMTNDNLLLYS